MPDQQPRLVAHLTNGSTSVVIAERNGSPFIAHIGASLGTAEIDPRLLCRGVLGGGLDVEIHPWLVAEPQGPWLGRPGIQMRRGASTPLQTRFLLRESESTESSSTLTLVDESHDIDLRLTIILDTSDVVRIDAACRNRGKENLAIDALRLTVPVGTHCEELLTLGGRHAMEAVEHRHRWSHAQHVLENRSGRTSHEQLGVVFAGTRGFSEQHGDVWGVHCAWSGNFEFLCDSVTDGMRIVQVGELLQPGEVVLGNGEEYSTPVIVVAHSESGINGVSHKFHRHVRDMHPAHHRPIIVNTWEAVYFDHDLDTLTRLATTAAEVGCERFVLDDGWFHGRRDDTAGLGDWWVDSTLWPHGLTPLVDHVTSLGMDFGLWFEPEMVNPNSELFRDHPQWALGGGDEPVLGRNQLVLNLALKEVRDYLFDTIDQLLSNHRIAYVKWDHNRPLVGGASHAQTLGTYELLERLRRSHPAVQFESCASGGGRMDMGIAPLVERFWTSDSIDALDRLTILKGASKLFPLEMLGSHIGSPTSHSTGRRHALSFRAATAMFGWLGVEWNLLSLSVDDKHHLGRVLSVYKELRPLLHTGDYVRYDHPDDSMHVHGVVARDRSEALISVSRIKNSHSLRSPHLLVTGLDPAGIYSVRLLDLGAPRWALHRRLPDWVDDGVTMSGVHLERHGLPCPPLLPESTMLIQVTRTSQ